jgi:putative NIF3 family GTP cyclohydrolase 1 type 2
MKAEALLSRILDESPWVDRANTVDAIVDGRSDKELRKILVVWRCGNDAMETAINGDYDGIVVHEPTYFFHRNEVAQLKAMPAFFDCRQ